RLTMAQTALNFQMAAAKDNAESVAKIEARNKATAALVGRIQDQIAVEKQAEATAGAMGNKIESLVLKYVSWTAAIAATVSVLKQMWQQGHEAAEVDLRLDVTLRAVGATSGRTADQLNKLAESMSRTTRFDDTAIKQGMTSMLKFSSVHSETFDQAIKVAVKYAEMSGSSLQASSQQIGRALENIASGRGSGGLRGLEEQFGKLTSTQRNYIDELVKLGQATDAQNYLLGIMNTKLGDIDTEMAGAANNSVPALKKAWKELMEELGKPPKEGGVLDWFIRKGAESIANWARFLKDDGGAGAESKLRSDLEWMIERGKTAEPKGADDAHYAKIIDQAVEAKKKLAQLNADSIDRQIERDLIEGTKRDKAAEAAAKESARRAEEQKTEEWKKGAAKRKAIDDKANADYVKSITEQEKIMEEAQKLGNEFLMKQDAERLKELKRVRDINIKGEVAMAQKIVDEDFAAAQQIARDQIAENDRVTEYERRAAEERNEIHRKQAEEMNHDLTDAIMRGFESGKSFAENFRDTVVNMFKTLVLRPIISAVLSPVTGAMASAATNAGLSGISNAAWSAGSTSLVGSVGGWMGSAAAGGVPVTSTLGAVASGAGYAGAGSTGMMGTASSTLAAIPGWGWAALAAAAVATYILSSGDGDAQRTGNWSGGFGKSTTSTSNRWFSGSEMGATMAQFSTELAASEQQMVTLLKLNASQIGTIDTKLAKLSGTQYGFGMEHTDWTQSGAPQAIAANRFRAVAESLGLSVEALTQKMLDAQKVIDLAPQKRQLEIQLMQLQGKELEALTAMREDELKQFDPMLHALVKQIYAEQDLVTAREKEAVAVQDLIDTINNDLNAALSDTNSAMGEQASNTRTAANAAHQLSEAYKRVSDG
ncbi:MAG: hypothetical protein NUV75_03640, partial [Gallionella sp.]|nr:hypothetical protein [Gallionella sp.]